MTELKPLTTLKRTTDILHKLVEEEHWSAEDAMFFLNTIPDADVAPKSESEFDSIPVEAAESLKEKAVEKAKAEVAREIFEEIEKCMEHDYISSIGVYNGALELRIAELKKEYTEEKE
jgi:hypothetical protein